MVFLFPLEKIGLGMRMRLASALTVGQTHYDNDPVIVRDCD